MELREKRSRAILLLSLFLAGFLVMVYEVSWHRLLSLALGATLRSAALVLSLYMVGMGMGAWIFGREADMTKNPVRLLAGLHWSMGLSGGWSYLLLNIIPYIYRSLNFSTAEILAHLVAVLALLPGAMASGGMVPVMTRIFIRKKDELGQSLGMLYTLDAVGAISGSLAIGFLLLPFLGQAKSICLAMVMNLGLGFAILLSVSSSSDTDLKFEEKKKGKERIGEVGQKNLLLAAMALGFIGLGLQVVWNRAVRIYLPNSSYTFAMVAAVYLWGMGLGNSFFRWWVPRMRREEILLWWGLTAASFSVAGSAMILEHIPRTILFPLADLFRTESLRIFLPPFVVGTALAFLPTVILGFCSPLSCRLYVQNVEQVSGQVGWLRAMNTLGSAVGPLAAGFLLIPWLGVFRSLWLLAGLAAATSFLVASSPQKNKYRLASLAFSVVMLLVMILARPARILPPSMHQGTDVKRRQDKVIYYNETAEGTVIVTEDGYTGLRACYVNNSAVVGTSYDAIKVVKMLGHLPFLCGARRGRALVVGFGIGVTAATVASHPEVDEVDCVEITPGVRRAADFFNDFNNRVLENPKIKFIDGDGRHYLYRSREKYQIISADPTHPTLGCAQLYTKEYFQLCRERLTEDGIICQYLPFHGLTPEEFWGIVSTFRSVFPHASLWLGQAHGVLLGSPKPILIDFALWEAKVAGIDDPLFYKDPYAIAASLLLDESGLKEHSQDSRINNDNRNYLEFFDPRAKAQQNWWKNVSRTISNFEKIKEPFHNVTDSLRWNRYRQAQLKFIEALRRQSQGDRNGMIELMQQALLMAPENEEIRFLLQREIER